MANSFFCPGKKTAINKSFKVADSFSPEGFEEHPQKSSHAKNPDPLNPMAILRTQKHPCNMGSNPSIGGSKNPQNKRTMSFKEMKNPTEKLKICEGIVIKMGILRLAFPNAQCMVYYTYIYPLNYPVL